MSDSIIDARRRFPPYPQSTAEPEKNAEQKQEQWRERLLRLVREAATLREKLKATPRLGTADRKVLVRNLGRAIERKPGRNPRQVASDLFRFLFGEEGGLSKEKKRKRYIRFDGEPLTDHAPGEEYAANGPEFVRLIEGLADLLESGTDPKSAHNEMLLFVCDGTSFYGHSRPRLFQGQDLREKFKTTMDAMIDRIARETDVIQYFEEVQNYTIQTIPNTRDEISAETLANFHKRCLPVEKFKHAPRIGLGSRFNDEYTRLKLGGFDIRSEEPSTLYPRIRLARVYWPRQVLCLPASVPTKALVDIRTRPLLNTELAEALAAHEPDPSLDESDVEVRESAVRDWRTHREYDMWRSAISEAGLDPDHIDWRSFEDSPERHAVKGARWRTFWQATSVDLHLVADGKPEALQLGLSFHGRISWWTYAPKDLLRPGDDDLSDAVIENCTNMDEEIKWVPWMPAGERTYACRGFNRYQEPYPEEFEDEDPIEMWDLKNQQLWPMQAQEPWEFLNLRMKDWQEHHHSRDTTKRDDTELPSLRPLFDAPHDWTPAPDGTLASAILRSLAYGEGEARLDNKIMAAIDIRVRCLRDMREQLSGNFASALSRHGYGNTPKLTN